MTISITAISMAKKLTFSIMASVVYAECHFVECRLTDCHYVNCRGASRSGIHKTYYEKVVIFLNLMVP
jgi:hypothetical protein